MLDNLKNIPVFLLFMVAIFGKAHDLPKKHIKQSEEKEISSKKSKNPKINGVSFVATPKAFKDNPFTPLQHLGANWISVIPYGFTKKGSNSVHYGSSRQWWGERPEGVIETIQRAHKNGLHVMLKPQIYVPDSWPGGIAFSNEKDWQTWEKSYQEFLYTFVKIADSMHVEMLCIGTEFAYSTGHRSTFWKSLIKQIRKNYKGKITYAANWDEYKHIDFWSQLDYIGIDAYFPLSKSKIPEVKELVQNWQPLVSEINRISTQVSKPVIFTEYGYLSVDKCCYNTWDLEKNIDVCQINEKAQANALEALYKVFYNQKWWQGGFLWKWFPEMKGHEGYPEKDYTPQGKLAENVVKKWFHQ